MSMWKAIEVEIDGYLTQVKAHLGNLTGEEVDEILSSIRSHIDTALAEYSNGDSDLEAVKAVLAELDPPESYAENLLLSAEEPPLETQFSKHAAIGAALLPFGIILAFTMMSVSSSSSTTYVDGTAVVERGRSIWQWLASFILIPLGIISPFAATSLGLMGISKIRNSKGTISGLPLAFFVTVFYPIIILDTVLFMIAVSLFQEASYWNIAAVITLALILALDYYAVRKGWRTAAGAI